MNNGKICVSVCAKTADELIEQIKRSESLADVIEIRFDCLEDDSRILDVLKEISDWKKQIKKPFLFTFRPTEQGGKKVLEKDKRISFWSWRDDGKGNFGGKAVLNADLVDLEADLIEDSTWATRFKNSFGNAKIKEFFDSFRETVVESYLEETIISSHHDFIGVPDNLNQIYQKLSLSKADITKIAVQTDDITDSLSIWQLLKRAKSENKEIIPIAMGESGKWTRILGLAHGAFMTYASLDSDKETAPGQVTAKDLIEVYRAKELDETTEVYGILGNNVGVSLSPYIHNTAFKFHKLNSVFVPLQVHDLDEFIKRMVKPETREVELNFKGFSVTIPHKQSIIKHLDYIDETAKKIGAVNTVKIVDGKLYGYNTDAKGFIEPLKQVYGDLSGVKVGILGAGGAARACIYALQKENADVTVFAKNIEKAKNLVDDFQVDLQEIQDPKSKIQTQDIIVNSTPLGMKGKAENETPLTAEQMKNAKLVYDLVYIPFHTQFMKEADKVEVPKIGGMAMLVAQAIEQQRIWTDLEAPLKEISAEVLKRIG